jgi:hypothetical protein
MLEFGELLTLNPLSVTQGDVDLVRTASWRDEDVVDIVHVVGIFNYLVRMADGLGIGIEPEEAEHLKELPFHHQVTAKAVGNAVEGPSAAVPQGSPGAGGAIIPPS